MNIKREELLCGDLAYGNAVIAELCGYPKLLLKLHTLVKLVSIFIYFNFA